MQSTRLENSLVRCTTQTVGECWLVTDLIKLVKEGFIVFIFVMEMELDGSHLYGIC